MRVRRREASEPDGSHGRPPADPGGSDSPSRGRDARLRLDRAQRARRGGGHRLQRPGGLDGQRHRRRPFHRVADPPHPKMRGSPTRGRGRRRGHRHAAAHPALLRRRGQRRRSGQGPQGARHAQGRHRRPEAAAAGVRDRHAPELRDAGRRHRGPATRPHVVPQEQRPRPRRAGVARRSPAGGPLRPRRGAPDALPHGRPDLRRRRRRRAAADAG